MIENSVTVSSNDFLRFLDKIRTVVLLEPVTGPEVGLWANVKIDALCLEHQKTGFIRPRLLFLMTNPENASQTVECSLNIAPFAQDEEMSDNLFQFLPGFLADMGVKCTVYACEVDSITCGEGDAEIVHINQLIQQRDLEALGAKTTRSLLFSVETPSSQRAIFYTIQGSTLEFEREVLDNDFDGDFVDEFNLLVPRVPDPGRIH